MKALLVTIWLVVASVGHAGIIGNGGWVVDGEPEPLPPPVGLSSNSIDPVTDAAYRAVPSWEQVLGIGSVADRDIAMGGHSITGVASVVVSNTVEAGTFRSHGYDLWIKSPLGDPTDFVRIVNTNAFAWIYWLPAKDGIFAMLSDIPSTAGMVTNGGNATLGTVSVGSLTIEGNVPVTNLPSLAGFVTNGGNATLGTVNVSNLTIGGNVPVTNLPSLAGFVTNGGSANLSTVTVTSLTINGNVPLTNAPASAALVFYVSRFTQVVDLVNTDTGAVPNEVYGINLKSAGVIAKDTYSAWQTNVAKFVVGSNLVGKDLHVEFDSVIQGAGGVGSGYAKRRKITFPTVVGTLTNFPVLVKFTASEYTGFQGTNGADLRFTDDAGTELLYEVDGWNSGTNSFVWVQVPTLTNGAVVWAYWGKVGVSAPLYTANGSTWTNFNLVAHMGQTNLLDSTALHNNADRNGIHTNANGVVGGGRGFLRGDGIGWQPNFPTNVGIGMSNGFAVEAWVNKVNTGGTDGYIGMYHSGGWPFVDSVRINTDGSDVPYMTLRRIGADADVTGTAASAIPSNQWIYMAGIFDGSTVTFYTNGVKAGQSSVSAGNVNLTGKSWFLASYGDAEGYQNIRFTGVMDEVRLSKVARGSNWVWATYRTMASNATWQTYGAIEDNDGDWPGIFVNGAPLAAGGTILSANEESRSVSGWVLAPTNGTQITFGARLKRYGNTLHLGTGAMQRVTITAY